MRLVELGGSHFIPQLSNLVSLWQEWGRGGNKRELTLLSIYRYYVPDNNLRDIIIMPIFKNGEKNPRLRRVEKLEKSHITSKTGKMELK